MKLPNVFKNWVSVLGAIIAAFNVALILFLFILTLFFDVGSSYVGLFIYIILPIFLLGGLLLIPLGYIITKKKTREEKAPIKWPIIDFNSASTRNASIIFSTGTILLIIFSSVGSYEAFHYTESVEFCGKLCHEVMKPEYIAYHESSHERVTCVECHVGSGADWYVKSKLSGLYQVYSVLLNKYPKPIEVPIQDLRPARETCEQCHWPEKFYDNKLRVKRSYLADEETTEWDIHLRMKTSGNHESMGNIEGIHWHINPDIKIEYKAADKSREIIPWVKYTNLKTGESIIYEDEEYQLSNEKIDSLKSRTMDCIDCHNRPSHNYQIPQNFIDDAITSGKLPKHLPDIKIAVMEPFLEEYSTTDTAHLMIESKIMEYYDLLYPELMKSEEQTIKKAILVTQELYSKNIFPEMKVSWEAFPNHLGHLETEGCHRCHTDRHVSLTKQVISRDCNLCHDITAQGNPDNMEIAETLGSLEFKHPIPIREVWKKGQCAECHSQLY